MVAMWHTSRNVCGIFEYHRSLQVAQSCCWWLEGNELTLFNGWYSSTPLVPRWIASPHLPWYRHPMNRISRSVKSCGTSCKALIGSEMFESPLLQVPDELSCLHWLVSLDSKGSSEFHDCNICSRLQFSQLCPGVDPTMHKNHGPTL